MARGGHDQFPVFNSPDGGYGIGNTADNMVFSFQDNHLQAVLMIYMDMGGGNNDVEVIMLNSVQFTGEVTLVVVVNDAENTYRF
jgi:hypothetical protein